MKIITERNGIAVTMTWEIPLLPETALQTSHWMRRIMAAKTANKPKLVDLSEYAENIAHVLSRAMRGTATARTAKQ